ncbi:aminopeptidase [Microbulbifer spongiae]|uniref:Aminopeptidase n=1 Tax=Microbulbifer spongiae TaxID=2944933 RepID=A0ABY9EBR4_9GAMM|nr:aminopeptidase [Microbulbifer sp. MI-G]WKD49597.1 aminopeptidase [Microbulbifer sp. MI-G]
MYISIATPKLPKHSGALRAWALIVAAVLLGGCETVAYYSQAAAGQWRILSARQSIAALLEEPGTDAHLLAQLRLIQDIRAYAARELRLPVGEAYATYVALDSEYPIWNVFAAPEFSLVPKRWCYPIAGCASYRGYFRQSAAVAKAAQLRAQGYDVYLGAVPAYSTLGWFDDPALSSFVNWSPERLAGLLFHELAHRRVYIPGDTQFNESFATAVSEIAVPDWLKSQGLTSSATELRTETMAVRQLMLTARRQLESIYRTSQPVDLKRDQKAQVLRRLRRCYRTISADWPNPERYRVYIEKTNNATLALAAEYESQVPAFRQLYLESGSWEAFYTAAQRLGALDTVERAQRLRQLGAIYRRSRSGERAEAAYPVDACMAGKG